MSTATEASSRPRTGRGKTPPGPRGHLLFGCLPDFLKRPIQFYTELHERYGDVVRFEGVPGMPAYVVFHPEGVDHVLRANHASYGKGRIVGQFRVLDGEGLVTSEGDLWVRQRRLAQPAFHRSSLAKLAEPMARVAQELVERWRPYAVSGEAFDVQPEMMHVTLRIASETLFSTDISAEAAEISEAVDVARDYITSRMFSPLPLPVWVPTPSNRRFLAAKAVLDRIVYRIIGERRKADVVEANDLIGMFMAARDEETGEGMSDRQLRDEVMTMMMAGHESTAVALTWVFHRLGRHPEALERLRAEVDAALAGRPPVPDDLPNLGYTRRVIEETLRLHPVVWAMARQALRDDEIDGYRIPARANVFMAQYVTHRDPRFWEDPERFDPDRFLPERSAGRPRYAWFPFGGGPRGCIGSQFSLMEGQLLLAALVQRYDLRAVPDHPIDEEPLLSLRPKHGVRVTLRERG